MRILFAPPPSLPGGKQLLRNFVPNDLIDHEVELRISAEAEMYFASNGTQLVRNPRSGSLDYISYGNFASAVHRRLLEIPSICPADSNPSR